MRIENLAKSEKSKEKFVVTFENGTNIKVSTAQIADFGLYSGREFTPEEYNELKSAIELSSAKASALRILGSRSLSAHDMERRLTGKGVSAETAGAVVGWLVGCGMINDTEFAAEIVSHYSAKGYGPMRIKDELYKRGVPREVSAEAMSSLDEAANGDAAFEFARKKLDGSTDKADVHNVINALCRRGFSYEDARIAVREYLESAEEAAGAE